MNYNIANKFGSDLYQVFLCETLDQRLRWYTGLRVKAWDIKKQRAKGEESTSINNDLDKIESIYREIKKQLKEVGEPTAANVKYLLNCDRIFVSENYIDEIRESIKKIPSKGDFLECFKLFIKASEDGTRKTKQGKAIALNTIKKYKVAQRLLERFSTDEKYPLIWENINEDFYNKLTRYCWREGFYDNGVGTVIAVIMAMLNWCVDEKIIKHKIYTKKWIVWKEEEVDALVLYPDEIPILYNMPLVGKLDDVRDLFVFGCLTLLRGGNLLNLYESDLKIMGDAWHIDAVQVKVGKKLWIKLPPIAVAIIQKHREKHKTLLPDYTHDHYAKCLKKLAKKFREHLEEIKEETKGKVLNEWDKPFTRIRYKQGVPHKIEVDICKLLNPHSERSTGTTTLLIMGMREFEVKKIGGWEKNSKSFGKYVRLAQRFIDAQSDSAWDKVFTPELKVV
jgi:hypothetical protein